MRQWVFLTFLLAAVGLKAAEPVKIGLATYYTVKSCQKEGTSGVYTANSETYDENALTCAMRDKRCYRKASASVYFKVMNLNNNKSCIVRLNDFGPGVGPTKRGVIIDLTPAAKKAIGMKGGEVKVSVEEVPKP
jgi:rare lipoprotein A